MIDKYYCLLDDSIAAMSDDKMITTTFPDAALAALLEKIKEWRISFDIFFWEIFKSEIYINPKRQGLSEGGKIHFIARERKSMQLFLIKKKSEKDNDQKKEALFWEGAGKDIRLNKQEGDQPVHAEGQNAQENFNIPVADWMLFVPVAKRLIQELYF